MYKNLDQESMFDSIWQFPDDLKKAEGEATIVNWVKAGWTDYKVKKLEGFVQASIDKHNEKATETEVASKDTSYAAVPTVTPDANSGTE